MNISQYNLVNFKKNRTDIISVLVLFFVLNGLKLTLFNLAVMSSQSVETFLYKYIFSLLLNTIILITVFKHRSPRLFLIFYIIESIYIFTILSYYSYFHNYLHLLQATVLFTEGVGSLKHITIPVDYKHLCILVDLIPAIYILRNYKKANTLNTYLKPWFKYIIIAFIITIAGSEAWHYTKNDSIFTLVKDYSKNEIVFVERYGTVISDIFNTILNNGGKSYASHIEYGEAIESSAEITDKPNIVVIQVESLDSNVVNQMHNSEYIAPYLHSLSERAIYYPYALSYHLAGGTSDAEFSIINSVEPLSSFPSIKLSKYDYPNSVVKQFKDNSYKTYAFHGNIGNFYNRDAAFKKMGFDYFYDIRKMGFKDEGWGAPDHEVFNYVANKLENEDAPFLSYIITMSSHMPFSNTKEYYSNSNYSDIKDETVKNYFTSISYVDKSIGDFVEQFQSRHKNTYFIILGDHTPDIKKDEYMQASYTSGNKYYEFVPVFIITPDNRNYIENKIAASFLDVAPTMLSAAGIPFRYKSDGIDLINPPRAVNKIPFKQNVYDRSELFNNIIQNQKR